jgi:hypothetical protein
VKYLFLLALFFSVSSHAQLSGWKLAREANQIKVWLRNTNPEITGTLEIRASKKKIDWSKIQRDSYFKTLEAKKIKLLSFIGITQWHAQETSWREQQGVHYLKITGSYTNSSQEKILFIEEHAFLKDKTVQLLHTRPAELQDQHSEGEAIMSFMRKESGVFYP